MGKEDANSLDIYLVLRQGGFTHIHVNIAGRSATVVKLRVNGQVKILSIVNSQATASLWCTVYSQIGQGSISNKAYNCMINALPQ